MSCTLGTATYGSAAYCHPDTFLYEDGRWANKHLLFMLGGLKSRDFEADIAVCKVPTANSCTYVYLEFPVHHMLSLFD